MTGSTTTTAGQRIIGEVMDAIRAAKRDDPFAPVTVLTCLGARRLRLELGRNMSMVNVRVADPRASSNNSNDNSDSNHGEELLIAIGPLPADHAVAERTRVNTIDIDEPLSLGTSRVISCPEASVEARAAVSALLDARRRGIAWSSMAVAIAAHSSRPMLLDALTRAGIPFHASGGRPILQSGAARFVIGAINASSSNWNRGAVSALWASVPLLDPASGELVPVRQWERLSRRWGVVDANDWPLLPRRCDTSNKSVNNNTNSNSANNRDAAEATHLAQWIADLATTVANAEAPDLAAALSRFLPAPGSPRARAVYGASADAEGEAQDVVRRVLVAFPSRADRSDVAERIAWVQHELADRSMGGIGRVGEGVQVGSPESLALGSFDDVVIIGLSDEATRRDEVARRTRTAALTLLLHGRSCTLTVPRSSAASQREVAPMPELFAALSERVAMPVTAEEVHAWPSKLAGVGMVPSWSAAVTGSDQGGSFAPLDDADVRLAALDAWTRAGGDLSAHALVAGDPVVTAALHADRARRSVEWSPYDGMVDDLSGWSPASSAWAVTTMETFHKCRLRVFLSGVLGARPLERPEDDATPTARSTGSFVHRVFEVLTSEHLAIDSEARPSWPDWLRALDPSYLDELMERVASDMRADGRLGRGPWWDAHVRWLAARLRLYLETEARTHDGFEPLAVEIGPTYDVPWQLETPIGDVSFLGRADRIEANGPTLRVVDYKTGRLASLKKIAGGADQLDGGRALQLPVYAAMLAERAGFDPAAAHGLYVNPTNPNPQKRRVDLSVGALVDAATSTLSTAMATMAAGDFTYATTLERGQESTCTFCDLKACCPTDRVVIGRAKAAVTAAATTPAEEVAS